MNTKTTLWVTIGILFLAVLFSVFVFGTNTQAEQIPATANAVKSAASSYGGMVGGC